MKMAEEKAVEVCKTLKLPERGAAFIAIQAMIKEQDRDTRHACAEAARIAAADNAGTNIVGDAVHAACMNVRAV